MSRIVVIGFDTEEQAREALKSLRNVEKQGGISFEDTAVVVHHADGRMEVKNEASGAAEGGAVVGALVGGLLFVMFPVVGIALGALAGAGVARRWDGRQRRLREGRQGLAAARQVGAVPGRQERRCDMAIATLRRFHGEVIQTSLDEETEEALRTALSS
jgi:uncharacterized membrane protein